MPGENAAAVVLSPLREIHESIDVTYSPPLIDFEKTSVDQSITENDIVSVPYPSTHSLRNALRILPGAVVQDAAGDIHFNGGAVNQTLWILDGFTINDPLTGRFATQLSVEAAQSVTLSSGRYSAEFGKGSAGVLAVETKMGSDVSRHSATNFVPGLETRKGGLTLGQWRPRVNLSGPIARGRAWFFNSMDARYTQNIVEELPGGEDRTSVLQVGNLFRTQINVTSSNILYAGFLASILNAPRSGLGALDPVETTVDRRARQYFFHIKDQIYVRSGALVEIGYARNRTFGREIPQDDGFYVFTPHGRRGNYFVDAQRCGERDQALVNAVFPSFGAAGTHQLKVGADLDRVAYRQQVQRTGFERRRLDGTTRRKVVFAGNGRFQRSNFEASGYIQDTWKPAEKLVLNLGIRHDWDSIVRKTNLSPRFAFSWSPEGLDHTKFSGGYAVLYDATTLQTMTRHLDQYSLSTLFDREGHIQHGPGLTLFTGDERDRNAPRYGNWSLGTEQRLPGDFFARASYLRKQGRDGFTFFNTLETDEAALAGGAPDFGATSLDAIFSLRNLRRDKFDSFEFMVRKSFRKQAFLMMSYTRSRARSNAALDISIDTPVTILNNAGPMPWDSPNRLVSWGRVPLSKKYALDYMLEWRSGFPFSVEDDEGRLVGPVNSRRLPDFFELNVSIERRLRFGGHRWALRVGAVNLSDSRNPTAVNNNSSSPSFLEFFGGTRRAFVTRIRWLGKVNYIASRFRPIRKR